MRNTWDRLTDRQKKRFFNTCTLRVVLGNTCNINECRNCGAVAAYFSVPKERRLKRR